MFHYIRCSLESREPTKKKKNLIFIYLVIAQKIVNYYFINYCQSVIK